MKHSFKDVTKSSCVVCENHKMTFFGTFPVANRQQPSPLLYSIDIWPARNFRLTQRETNHYIAQLYVGMVAEVCPKFNYHYLVDL